MAVKHLFLAILSEKKLHGYELKSEFEELVGGEWPLNFGQVYTTLMRLERDGLVVHEEVSQEEKPDKKIYGITQKGKEELDKWFHVIEEWNLYGDELSFKITALKIIDNQNVNELIRKYRLYLLKLIRELITIKGTIPEKDVKRFLLIERNILKAEADLKWLDICSEKLEGKE